MSSLLPDIKVSSDSFILVDKIHQFILNPPKGDLQSLLEQSISYTDEELDQDSKNELFFLIYYFFSLHPNQPYVFFVKLCTNILKSSNGLIIFVMIYSLTHRLSSIPAAQSLFLDIKRQMIEYVQKTPEDKMIIYNFEIEENYKANFISDIILSTELTEIIVSTIYPYIFSFKKISKERKIKLIEKVSNSDFFKYLPEEILTHKSFFESLSQEKLAIIIPKTSDQIFSQILPFLKEYFSELDNYFKPFISSVFDKIVEFRIDFSSINFMDQIYKNFDETMMKSTFWDFFAEKYIILPERISNEIKEFPDKVSVLYVIEEFDNIPLNTIFKGLFESNDFLIFHRFENSDLDLSNCENNEICSKKNFWIRVFSVISDSFQKYSKKMVVYFSTIFQKNVKKENLYEYFEAMIFNKFPTTEYGNNFLYDLLSEFNPEYKENFNCNLQSLLRKTIEKKVIPLLSFWRLFDFDFLNQFSEQKNLNPIFLYTYLFSKCNDSIVNIETLAIPNLNEENQSFVIEFFKSQDFNKLVDLNENLLSFIVYSIIFINQETKPSIVFLSDETILPFVAISFILMKRFGGNFMIKSSELTDILLDSCELSSKSHNLLVIESINTLIRFYNVFFDSILFPSDIAFEIFNIFITQLIKNIYKADRTLLIETFFDFPNFKSFQNSDLSCISVVQSLYDKNAINLFKFVYKNFNQIENFNQIKHKLNFNALTKNRIMSVLNKIIQKPSIYEDTVNLIYFLENFCVNVPNITIKDYSYLYKILNKALEKKDWINYVSLYSFIKKNNSTDFLYRKYRISNENEVNFLSFLLKAPQIETKDYFFEILFNTIMKKPLFIIIYIITLLDKISCNYTIEPELILKSYSKEFQIYVDFFQKAVECSYDRFYYDSKDIFVMNFCYIEFNHPLLINRLFKYVEKNPNNYNAFLCLQNIASAFPYFFNKDSILVCEMVLPALDSFSLMFTDSDEHQKIKIALSAQHFLFSCLYSVEFLDSSIPWILNNISSFTSSQILAFLFILHSLFDTKKVKDIILALFLSNNFVQIALNLLKIEIKDKNVNYIYKANIYKLLIKFYDELNKLSKRKKIVFIEQMSTSDKPFALMFNKKLTILPIQLKSLDFSNAHNYQISEFIEAISKPKSFWLSSKNEQRLVNIDEINDFLTHFKKSEAFSDYEIPETKYNFIIQTCAKNPNWIYQFIVKVKIIPLNYLNHYKIKRAIKELHEIYSYNMRFSESVKIYKEINVDQIFSNQFNQVGLFDLLINNIEQDNKNYIYFHLFKSIIYNKVSACNIINLVTDYINCNLDNLDSVKRVLRAFDFVNNVELFYAPFKDSVKEIINCALKPEIRVDAICVSCILKILYLFDFVNWRASYLLGFFLIHGTYKVLPQVASFCKKFGERLLENIMNLVEASFSELVKNEGTSSRVVALVLEGIPSLIKTNMYLTPLLIDLLFTRYNEGDRSVISMITTLMNSITPDRMNDQLIGDDEETEEIDFSIIDSSRSTRNTSRSSSRMIKHISQNLVKNNPEFWNLYMKHRDIINKIISHDHIDLTKFKILNNFPELVSFDVRLLKFRKILTSKINKYYETEFFIRRSNILVDSFEQLNELSQNYWLNKFRIKFVDEIGADYGGLTKEWFTLVIQELFNPNFGLFKKVENQSYQPNPFSGINNEHIEYFRFAGKLIARAIIQEQCVNAHFTRSFRRQILHTQLKLNDYEDIDKEIYNSMKSILENDVDPLCLNFTIDDDEYGVIKTVPLKENGENIDVTNENKFEYISLYINYRLRKSIINQVTAFCDGFNWLIPRDEIRLFSQSELDLIICGIPKIDVDDLRENTVYNHPYHKTHKVIIMFFNVISKWDSDNLAKFLLFLTGSSQVPVNGFKDYNERGNPIRISPGGDKNRLCVAHTCFNTLDLPEYDNEDDLNRKLLLAVQECNEFALA